MTDVKWNPDLFCAELKERLAALLSGGAQRSQLALVVEVCIEAAESLCRERLLACGAGCPHCCVLNVAILLPEAMVIADWLQNALLPVELEVLKKKLALHRCWGRWMDDEERITKKEVCPFLDLAGCCLIHAVRPLACRGVSSLDSGCCREALAPSRGDEPPLVPSDLLRRAAYDESFRTLANLLKMYWLDARSIELGTGVLAFLEEPPLVDQFLSGRRLPDELWRV